MKRIFVVLVTVFIFQGCAAARIAIEHKDLAISTRMSDSIFLELTDAVENTVFVDIKNTSDKDLQVNEKIKAAIASRGYKVVKNFKKAFYHLRGNILFVGKTDPSAAENALANGFGGGLAGVAIGSEIGGTGAMIGFGLAAAAVEVVTNALTKNVTFTIITDLQISERSADIITQSVESKFTQGETSSTLVPVEKGSEFLNPEHKKDFRDHLNKGTIIKQNSTVKTNRRKYRTRVVSTANQVNLEFEEAQAVLEDNLAKSIGGIF